MSEKKTPYQIGKEAAGNYRLFTEAHSNLYGLTEPDDIVLFTGGGSKDELERAEWQADADPGNIDAAFNKIAAKEAFEEDKVSLAEAKERGAQQLKEYGAELHDLAVAEARHSGVAIDVEQSPAAGQSIEVHATR